MRAAVDAGRRSGIFAGSGLDPDTLTVFALLRNTYPDRSVPVRNFRAPFIYQDPAKFETALSRMVETGLVDIAPTRSVTLSDHGRVLITQVRDLSAQAATDLLGSGTLPVFPLADRCLLAAAATATPDGAFHLVAPPHDEPDDSDAIRLAERLTGLRWHRFDAHVAAWTSAGLSAQSVTDLGPGQERDEIEAGTNERAGQAYAVLTPDERTTLLQGLG
jgi:hypothetical protein